MMLAKTLIVRPLLAAALGLIATASIAHDLDKTDHNSPEVSAWVTSLKNGPGVACCATADGWKPQRVECRFWLVAPTTPHWKRSPGQVKPRPCPGLAAC